MLGVASPSDQCSVAAGNVVFNTRAKTLDAIYFAASQFVNGKLEPKVYDLGVAEGVIDILWCPEFKDKYPELVKLGAQVMQDVAAGKVPNPETATQ